MRETIWKSGNLGLPIRNGNQKRGNRTEKVRMTEKAGDRREIEHYRKKRKSIKFYACAKHSGNLGLAIGNGKQKRGNRTEKVRLIEQEIEEK